MNKFKRHSSYVIGNGPEWQSGTLRVNSPEIIDPDVVRNFNKSNRQQDEGTKYDTGKPPLSLIPRAALEAEANVFAFGAKKYGRDNYKLGMDYTRLIDAALRHVNAFGDDEDLDPESGLSHLAHARCCLGMLLHYIESSTGTDDRYKTASEATTMKEGE